MIDEAEKNSVGEAQPSHVQSVGRPRKTLGSSVAPSFMPEFCTDCAPVFVRGMYMGRVSLCAKHSGHAALYEAAQTALPVVEFYATLLQNPDNRKHYLKIGAQLRLALADQGGEKE